MSAFSHITKGAGGRRFPGIKGRAPHQYGLRCEVAAANAKARAKRSHKQQWALLDARLGAGVGAKKERARLARRINRRFP